VCCPLQKATARSGESPTAAGDRDIADQQQFCSEVTRPEPRQTAHKRHWSLSDTMGHRHLRLAAADGEPAEPDGACAVPCRAMILSLIWS
jgi:hypothetical protein